MAIETQVELYSSASEYRRDADRMARRGWRVVSVLQEKRGCCGGCLLFGVFSGFLPRQTIYVVTYERGGST